MFIIPKGKSHCFGEINCGNPNWLPGGRAEEGLEDTLLALGIEGELIPERDESRGHIKVDCEETMGLHTDVHGICFFGGRQRGGIHVVPGTELGEG